LAINPANITIEKIFFTGPGFVAIRCAISIPQSGVGPMSTVKEDLELDEDLVVEEADDSGERVVEVAKTNLTKRRIIDNYLEERRLQKQLNDYDFDL
jgi:hypothetical protein